MRTQEQAAAGAAHAYVWQEFNGGQSPHLIVSNPGAYLESVVVRGHHGDAISMHTTSTKAVALGCLTLYRSKEHICL